MENIIPDKIGIIVKGNCSKALYEGMKKLLSKEKLEIMSQ